MTPSTVSFLRSISRHHFSMLYREFRYYLAQDKIEDKRREAQFFSKLCNALNIDDTVMFIICLSVHGEL